MPKGLLYSTDGGATFNTVSVDVADYTLSSGSIANAFYSVKDSSNNTYIFCMLIVGNGSSAKLIKIASSGAKTICTLNWNSSASPPVQCLCMSRDEQYVIFGQNFGLNFIPVNFTNGENIALQTFAAGKIAIYKDQYIWVSNSTTAKIYNYTTKVEMDSETVVASLGFCCDFNNIAYSISANKLEKLTFDGIATITRTNYTLTGAFTNAKQIYADRFGDLIILTNTGTASTLLKYSNTGTLIDTVSLSVGTNKGAYGLQVYSKDNGTKCWVQFGNDLGTWRTAETTAQGQVFGAVSKLSAISTGELTYNDDNGGDNNYSVWCP